MHSQLRRCVTMELATNASRYLNNEWLSLRMGDGFMSSTSVSHLIATYTRSFNQLPTTDDFIVWEVLNNETLETAADGTWCGLWHFAALANILHRPIVSVYPRRGAGPCYPQFNRRFVPFNEEFRGRQPVFIMWTPTTHGGCTNHFVPLLPLECN